MSHASPLWLALAIIVLSWAASAVWRVLRMLAPVAIYDPEVDDRRD